MYVYECQLHRNWCDCKGAKVFDTPLAKDPTDLQPLEWSPVRLDGRWTARMRCRNVHTDDIGLLSLHTISEDGLVDPSVECTEGDFHEQNVRLVGWKEEIARQEKVRSG